MTSTFSMDWLFAAIIFFIGAYCMAVSRNLIKQLIGLEIISKAALIALISAGALSGNTNLAQALIITAILVEAVIVATGLALLVKAYKVNGAIDIKKLNNMRG
ncbi:MAG: NADH-quinone oxidoreductase subunit K [Elusimicrobiota bacterium]